MFNSNFNLSEEISKSKIVKKDLKSHSKRFRPKVIIIKDNRNVDFLRVMV